MGDSADPSVARFQPPTLHRCRSVAYMSSVVNETVDTPTVYEKAASLGHRVQFNERSLYVVPGSPQTRPELVLLLRSSRGPSHLWASRCTLSGALEGTRHGVAASTLLSASGANSHTCKSGTGAYEYEQPTLWLNSPGASLAGVNGDLPPPLQCNWTLPRETNLPDAPSRTCAATLPSGAIGLLGNQGGNDPTGKHSPRDPLTFVVADDGLHFAKHMVVRSGAPKPKYFGYQGFQYPSFMWCKDCGNVQDEILFVYSVSKEDIVVTRAPLGSVL